FSRRMLRSPMRTSIAIGSGSLSQPHFRSIFSARSSYQLIGQRDTAPSSGFVTPGTPSQPAATADDAPPVAQTQPLGAEQVKAVRDRPNPEFRRSRRDRRRERPRACGTNAARFAG